MDMIYLCGGLVFISLFLKSFHLISFLISLEFFSLLLYCILLFSFLNYMDFFFFFFFVVVMACESVVGLMIFVFFTRYFSKDYMEEVGLLKF